MYSVCSRQKEGDLLLKKGTENEIHKALNTAIRLSQDGHDEVLVYDGSGITFHVIKQRVVIPHRDDLRSQMLQILVGLKIEKKPLVEKGASHA